MSRNYSREWYMSKIEMIRNIIPGCGISCDIITGFCTETEEEHQDTLTLMEWSKFDFSYMYTYSERPGTTAAKKFEDDVPEEVKKRRLQEIIAVQHKMSHQKNLDRVGMVCEVLIEGNSKKSNQEWMGRNDTNNVVVFPKGELQNW
jgi:tRNA-2-methylthio-N6-dimethylallyladenosine synthase